MVQHPIDQYLLLASKGRLSPGKKKTPGFRRSTSLRLLELIRNFFYLFGTAAAEELLCEWAKGINTACRHDRSFMLANVAFIVAPVVHAKPEHQTLCRAIVYTAWSLLSTDRSWRSGVSSCVRPKYYLVGTQPFTAACGAVSDIPGVL